MKRMSIVLSVLDLVLFTATVVFAAQTGDPRGAPQIPTAVQSHRPANTARNESAEIGHKPEDGGKTESAGVENAMGFKNYGQYIAAKHISENLNISPDALRTEVVENRLSLADAIKKLRPDLSTQTTRAEVKKAEVAAKKTEARYEPIDHLPVRLSN